MEKDEPLLEKVLHGLVKKHIAGTTMSSALEKAKEINRKNCAASITFLSGNVIDKSKARYITTTYIELIRRISRLGIKASIQVPVEQLGFAIDEEAASKNLSEIVSFGSRYGVFVWAELHSPAYDLYSKLKGNTRAFGLAFPCEDLRVYERRYRNARAVKILFSSEKGKNGNGYYKEIFNEIKASNEINNCVFSGLPDSAFRSLINNGARKEHSFAFEYGLGYSNSKLAKAAKKGVRLSIMVPFGKDWIDYATTNVPEGYMRFFAKRLLNE